MKHCYFHATLLFFFLTLFKIGAYAQANNMEEAFLRMKRYVVGIGVIVNDTINVNGRRVPVRKFQAIGSGFLTYSKYKTTTINNVITAAHVAKYFVDNNIGTVYIRPSWADTIKTTEYFGVRVPRLNSDKTPNIFFYPDKSVDLASILIPEMYFDTLFLRKTEQIGNVLISLHKYDLLLHWRSSMDCRIPRTHSIRISVKVFVQHFNFQARLYYLEAFSKHDKSRFK